MSLQLHRIKQAVLVEEEDVLVGTLAFSFCLLKSIFTALHYA